MWKTKKSQVAEKSDLKYWVISSVKIDLWFMILEANKNYSIDEKIYLLLKDNIFTKKWSLKLFIWQK